MGRLKPGATYIYERIDGAVYAREQGQPADTRIKIGETSIEEFLEKEQEWAQIYKNRKSSVALEKAVEETIIIYKLSGDYKDGV
tara:strand:+ start:70 stop:321 length:252 start_codon:yes stop_codon:yes gene_type:complete